MKPGFLPISLARSADRLVAKGALAILAVCLSLAAAATMWVRFDTAPSSEVNLFELGGKRFGVPGTWIRSVASSAAGRMARIDLLANWAEFVGETNPDEEAKTLFLSLTEIDDAMAPADRPSLLYAKFLSQDAEAGDGNLVKRLFRKGTPYENEDLYLTPPDGRAFSARCLKPEQAGALKETCLSELRFGDLNLQLRFDPVLLPEWDRMVEAAKERFGSK